MNGNNWRTKLKLLAASCKELFYKCPIIQPEGNPPHTVVRGVGMHAACYNINQAIAIEITGLTGKLMCGAFADFPLSELHTTVVFQPDDALGFRITPNVKCTYSKQISRLLRSRR